MKKTLFLICFVSLGSFVNCQNIDHQLWTDFLKKYVTQSGIVNYKLMIEDSSTLNQYLKQLESNSPKKTWSKNETMAYWINAYNAYTVKLILKHYPVKSIKEIGGKIPFVNSTWDIKFITIGNETLDLNNIEHTKLRKAYGDPRIHMALVCASKSCPKLLNQAFQPETLDIQLDQAAQFFINDPSRNNITPKDPEVSMIFKWYVMDFKKSGGAISFINKYANQKIPEKQKLRHIHYDWSLNE